MCRYVRVAGYEGGAHVFSDGSDVSDMEFAVIFNKFASRASLEKDNKQNVLT